MASALRQRVRTSLKEFFIGNFKMGLFFCFLALLVASCSMLALFGNSKGANELATYAFYSIMLAVTLQIASTLKEERQSSRAITD